MMRTTALLNEQAKLVVGLAPRAPSSSTPDYVSLKGYSKCTVVILVDTGTAPTASAITMKQATAVAGTSEKALSFSTVYANIDAGAADTLTATTVTNDTFNTDNTADKDMMYVIEVDEEDLDINNGFDCIRAGTANATNSVLSVLYVLWPAKYGKSTPPAAITD